MAKRQQAKRSSKPQCFWCVTLMYRQKETHIADIPITHITDGQLMMLMQMIFAKQTLTNDEIVFAHLRRSVKKHRDLLSIRHYDSQDPISHEISDGSNWVHAIVVRPGDLHPVTGNVNA